MTSQEIQRRLREALSDPLPPEELAEVIYRVQSLRRQAALFSHLPLQDEEPMQVPLHEGHA